MARTRIASKNRYGFLALAAVAATIAACSSAASDDATVGVAQASAEACSAQSAWAEWKAYAKGAVVTYGGATYECAQPHTSQPGWTPSAVPALWTPVTCAGGGGGGGGTTGSANGGTTGAGTTTGGSSSTCDPNAWVYMGNDPNACNGHIGESCGWTPTNGSQGYHCQNASWGVACAAGGAGCSGGTTGGSGTTGGAGTTGGSGTTGGGTTGGGTTGGTLPPPNNGSLPKHALIGYWHNFTNPSGPAFPLSQVSNDWDVIDVAFASNAQPSGSVAFELDSSLNEAQFKADVAAKRAAGKKVVLSLGGQEGTVSLATASDTDNFVSSLTRIIKTYGFDGVDIDLESGAGVIHGAPIETNLVSAIKRIKANTLGDAFYLSMAPEHPYVQGGVVANTSIWGAYLPIIDGLRNDLTVLHVQLYNNGAVPTPWGNFNPMTVDMLVASADMLLEGFQPASGPAFAPLRADQVAFGLPSGPSSANPGNFTSVATIQSAYKCLATGASCGSHVPARKYPAFRGVMTWSINWDRHDGPASFSQPLASFLHAQP